MKTPKRYWDLVLCQPKPLNFVKKLEPKEIKTTIDVDSDLCCMSGCVNCIIGDQESSMTAFQEAEKQIELEKQNRLKAS
jgi:hypothetical protein